MPCIMTTASHIRRELLWLLIGLPLGLLLLPVLIFLAGMRVFGPYAGGEAGDLVNGFLRGLGQGEPACWLVAVGPYLVLLLLRLMVRGFRAPAEQSD
jgi:hypothetical protein